MFFRQVYDEALAQAAYVIGCQRTGEAIVFDPERDVDRYLDLARREGLRITAVAETHVHADFLSGSRELAARTGARVYVSGAGGPEWTPSWPGGAGGHDAVPHQILRDGDRFTIGGVEARVMHTPGHTPEHVAYLITDCGGGATEPMGLVSGDFIFVGDVGRPDLLETAVGRGGSAEPAARQLHASVRAFLDLPDFVQVWPAHGAGSACGKALGAVPQSTVGYERRFNPALRAAAGERTFVDFVLSGQPEPPLYFARMKRDNVAGPAILGRLPDPPRLGVDELRAADPQRVALVDTRPWSLFRGGHVAGSLWIPVGASFATDAGSLIGEHEDIILVAPGERVAEAVRLLVRVGLDRVTGWVDPADLDAYARAGGAMATMSELGAGEAMKLMDRGGLAVLDVRRAVEFAEGHLPGARNIAHTRLAAHTAGLPRDRRLLVQCLGGSRSGRACALLQRRGFIVANLEGGFRAWEQASGRVER